MTHRIDLRERLGDVRRLARRGHQPVTGHASSSSRACPGAAELIAAPRHDHRRWASCSARADLQGPAAEALPTATCPTTAFSASGDAGRRRPRIYRANMVPSARTTGVAMELVPRAGAPFRRCLRPRGGIEARPRRRSSRLAGRRRRRAARRVANGVPGKGRRRGARGGEELLNETQNLSLGDRERLFGYLEGARRIILPEPDPLLTATPKVPGLDSQKMSKSYGNAILMREDPGRGHEVDPHDADRSGAGAPLARAIRADARRRRCTRSRRTPPRVTGSSRAARRRASAVSIASSR